MRLRVDPRLGLVVLLLVIATASALAFSKSETTVAGGETAAHDITRFDEAVRVDGLLDGDVLLVGGRLLISGLVRGDVITLGTTITFGPEGRVEGDLVSIGGAVRGGRRDAVTGSFVARGSEGAGDVTLTSLGQLSTLSIAINLALLAGWLLVTILLALIGGREVRLTSLELRASPLHTFALGLVAFTSYVLSLVVLSFLIPFGVGVPLIILVSAVAVCAKIYGMVTVFHAIGTRLFGAKTRSDVSSRRLVRGDLALAVAGLVLLGLIRMIPFVGSFLWMLASIFGVGAALATRFGRREPWFIAVRQVSY